MIWWRKKFTVAGIHEYKLTNNINSVQSSLQSHSVLNTVFAKKKILLRLRQIFRLSDSEAIGVILIESEFKKGNVRLKTVFFKLQTRQKEKTGSVPHFKNKNIDTGCSTKHNSWWIALNVFFHVLYWKLKNFCRLFR